MPDNPLRDHQITDPYLEIYTFPDSLVCDKNNNIMETQSLCSNESSHLSNKMPVGHICSLLEIIITTCAMFLANLYKIRNRCKF